MSHAGVFLFSSKTINFPIDFPFVIQESAEKQQESYYSSLAALKIKVKDEEHRAARIQSELLSANKVAENWNIKYKSEKENREKLANQLLESNKLTNQKSEEIENVISEMERYRHLYNEISEKYNNERIVFKNDIGATRLDKIKHWF